jgi:hypothetical protein
MPLIEFRYCENHGMHTLFDFIIRPEGEKSGMGCVSCFRKTQGLPEISYGVVPFAVDSGKPFPSAPASEPTYDHMVVGNLERWKRSGAPGRWIAKHKGKVTGGDCQSLIKQLATSVYWPLDPRQVKELLTEKSRLYRKTMTK